MTLVTDAVDTAIDGLRETGYNLQWQANTAMRTTTLRFDIEVEGATEPEQEAVLAQLSEELKAELPGLVVNGDRNSADPTLSAMDGELKREHECTKFEINGASVFPEYKEDRNVWEYTVFITIYAEFGTPDYLLL